MARSASCTPFWTDMWWAILAAPTPSWWITRTITSSWTNRPVPRSIPTVSPVPFLITGESTRVKLWGEKTSVSSSSWPGATR